MNEPVDLRLASWLLVRLGTGPYLESLAGDLAEEYRQGRGRLWYWRQVLIGIAVSRTAALRHLAMSTLDAALAVFALLALGIGTLAWASVNQPPSPPHCPSAAAAATSPCGVAKGDN